MSQFDRDLTVKTGKGNDIIDFTGAQFLGATDIDPGAGTNTVTVP